MENEPVIIMLSAIYPYKGYLEKILNHLNKTKLDNSSIAFSIVIEILGLDGSLDCLCSLPEQYDILIHRYTIECMERIFPIFKNGYPDDVRVHEAIEASKKYADGELDKESWARSWAKLGVVCGAAKWTPAMIAGWASGFAIAIAGKGEEAIQLELLIKYFG